MKLPQYLKLIILIAATTISTKLSASHMFGADMTYISLGNAKYKIIVKAYRDCRGISMGTIDFKAFAGTNGSNGCGTVTPGTLTRTSIRDVTPACSTTTKPCNPSNTFATGKGIEEHIYETIVDFNSSPLNAFVNKSTCCEVTFYINQCCRNGTITTGPAGNDFYTTCMINICNIKKTKIKTNNSPKFSNEPAGFLCCNVPWYFNNGAIDTVDFDSISYKLVSGLNGIPNSLVSYAAPYTSTNPMTPFCIPPTTIKCKPNPTNNPPRGFFFDSTNGDIIAVPTKCDEAAVIVIEQTEWRQDSANGTWIIVGKSRRDMQIWILDDCGYNNAPIINGNFNLTVCEGDKICQKITVKDEMRTPNQVIPDTVIGNWNNGIPGATFKVVNSKLREKEFEFCWQTKKGDARPNSYMFTVTATDQHCTPPVISTRAFKVKVNPVIVATIKTQQLTCSTFVFSPNINSKVDTIKWEVFDYYSKKTIQYSKSENDSVTLSIGKYIIQLRVNNRLCYSQVSDTLNVINMSISTEPISKSSNINGQAQFNVSLNDTTAVYQWQSNHASMGWSNVPTNSIYSGTTTKKLTVNNIQLNNHKQLFRLIATKNTCKDTSEVAMLIVNDTCITNVYDTITVQDTLIINAKLTGTIPLKTNLIKVYPNPAKDYLVIDFGNYSSMAGYNITIFDVAGKSVYSSAINKASETIDLNTWTGKGVYFIKIYDKQSQQIENRKIVIQ